MTKRTNEMAGQDFFSSLRANTDFFLVRHGESEGNARNIIQGHKDYPLNDSGRKQAAAAGDWFKGKNIQAVYCSPLSRARETASIISATGCGICVQDDHAFKEIDTGIFSGLSTEEISLEYPETFAQYVTASWEAVPGAEKKTVLYDRAMDAWKVLRDRALEGSTSILTVTHGGFIQWMIRTVSGIREWMPLYPVGNCGIFHLRCTPWAETGLPLLQWQLLNHQPDAGLERVKPVF